MRIIGLGNDDRRDDAVGREVVRRLGELGVQAELKLSDGEPTQLLEWLSSEQDQWIVDAMRSGASVGTWRRLSAQQAIASQHFPMSSHYFGLAEILRLAQSLNTPLDHVEVIGIEVCDTGFGRGLSPQVEHALDQLLIELRARLL